jgi:hypothetical protein
MTVAAGRKATRRVALVGEPEANAPGTRLLIAELFEANRERLRVGLDRALDLIEDAFEARNTLAVKDALVEAGSDPYA